MKRLKKTFLLYGLGLLVAAGAVGLLTGCGDLPTAPLNTGDDGGKFSNAGRLAAFPLEEEVEKLVGILGGTLDVALGSGPSNLTIPADALNGPVIITMSAEQTKTSGGYYTEFDFGPDGLVFNKPSSLSLTLPYPDGKMVACYWYNPSTGKWDWQESQPVKNNKVVFSIRHFSKYGIS